MAARLPCPSPTPGVYSNSCPLSQWCHPTISSSVIPFSCCLLSFPAWGSFLRGQFFTSGVHSIGASASTSVLSMNIHDWFPLGWTGWISLQSKGLSRVFSNTTVQKHQFFSIQLSLLPNSHTHTWLLEKPYLWLDESLGFPDSSVGKESACNAGEGIGYPLQYLWVSLVVQLVKNLPEMWENGFDPWLGKIPWRRERLPTPVFWPREFHGLCSPWGYKELTRLGDFHFIWLDRPLSVK